MKNYNQLRKIVIYSGILLLAFFIETGCDSIFSPEDDKNSTENLVAFSATFSDSSDGTLFHQLIVADFNDPENFEVLNNEKLVRLGPVFSGDKSKILFGVPGLADGGYKIESYDLLTNQFDPLIVVNHDEFTDPRPLYGADIVFNHEGTGFYYNKTYWSQGVYFYSFADSSSRTLRRSVYPVAQIDNETLLVFGDSTTDDQSLDLGFYLIDTNGDYLEKINNAHLETRTNNNIITRSVQNLDHNPSTNLLVFSYSDSTLSGSKIVVTDLTGDYYKEYTQGNYFDDHPKWGPAGKIIFERRFLIDQRNTGYKIMEINTETDVVTEYLTPYKSQEAISFRFPEF